MFLTRRGCEPRPFHACGMQKEFYQAVLPSKGWYCLTLISDGNATNHFVNSVDDLVNLISNNKNQNVFVPPFNYKSNSRKADNAEFGKSLFIDLDVDPANPKKYPSKVDALNALDSFLTDSGLPPPLVVDSGGGVHAYWCFDADVPVADWKPVAERFKAYCLSKIRIDPVVTADAARVMRAPDTFNYKTDPPRPTAVLNLGDLEFYDFTTFKEFLGVTDEVVHGKDLLATIPKGLDEDTSSVAGGNFESFFIDIASKCGTPDGCQQIEYIIKNIATLEEPLWHSGLSIAWHCVDKDDAIHWISEGYPEYSPDNTIAKAQLTQGKPHSCETFEQRNPGGCGGCKHRGKITNPLALGRRVKPPPVAAAMSDGVIPLPEYMKPYVRSAKGSIFYQPPPVMDENGVPQAEDPTLLSVNDIYPFKRMYSEEQGECLMVRFCTEHDGSREFLFPMTAASNQEQFTELMYKIGAFFIPSSAKLFMGYFRQWGTFLQADSSAEQIRSQFGFDENGKSFIIGRKEITDTGETRPAAVSPLVSSFAKMMEPTGSFEVWKECAHELNKPSMELPALGLLAGFGSPLMRMTQTPGVSFCYISANSGTAKTGSLYAGLSVFSNPHAVCSHGKNSSTDNALIGQYLAHHNIMMGMDEVSNYDPQKASELIYRISQGKGKRRMRGSVNALREEEQPASLINGMSSNTSQYDQLATIKGSADGEMARLIEFPVKIPAAMTKDPTLGPRVFGGFKDNYAHAGPEYIKHYFSKGDLYVRALMLRWTNRFIADFGSDPAYRFYQSFIAATMSGGELAKEAGLIDLNLNRIYDVVMENLVQLKHGPTTLNSTDYSALVGEFFNKYQTGVLILNEGRAIVEPRTALIARGEVDNQVLYASKTAFKEFLATMKISTREFESATAKDNILMGTEKTRLSSGWKGSMPLPPVTVYKFRCQFPDELLAVSAGT